MKNNRNDPRANFDPTQDKFEPLTAEQEAADAKAAEALRRRLMFERSAPLIKVEGVNPFNADDETARQRQAYANAIRDGKAGVDYFPNQKCAQCGGLLWFDAERGRYREFHFADKHNVDEIVTLTRKRGNDDGSRALARTDFRELAAGMRRVPRDEDDE